MSHQAESWSPQVFMAELEDDAGRVVWLSPEDESYKIYVAKIATECR